MKEFGDGHVVGALGEELGHSDVVAAEEFGDGRVEIVCQVMAYLVMISRHVLVEEFGDGDVVAGQILGDSDAVLGAVQELSHSDVVAGEEAADHVVEELGHCDIVALGEEFGHRDVVCGLSKELSDANVVLVEEFGDRDVIGDLVEVKSGLLLQEFSDGHIIGHSQILCDVLHIDLQ